MLRLAPADQARRVRLGLTLARTAQDTFHRVIAFMTGVFVDRSLTFRHFHRGGPGSRPGGYRYLRV